MLSVNEWIAWINSVGDINVQVIETIALIAVIYMVRFILYRVINRNIDNVQQRYTWRESVDIALLLVAIVLLALLWAEWVRSMVTFFSIVAAATVLVSKEFFLNLIAYGLIIWRGLFDVGNRIEVDEMPGDVISIGPFYVTLAELEPLGEGGEHTGRVIKIPNATFLSHPVKNATLASEIIWSALYVEILPDSNLEKAKSILGDVINENAYKPSRRDLRRIKKSNEEIIFVKTEPSIFVKYSNNKIILRGRYLCKAFSKSSVENAISESLLARFLAEKDIFLATISNDLIHP